MAPPATPLPATEGAKPIPQAKADGRITASPLAKKIASEKGVDLSVSMQLTII